MTVSPDAIFCDGEIIHGELLDRPIGLFLVPRFHEILASGAREFLPDRLFWHGLEHAPGDLRHVVEKAVEDTTEFGLCPVTEVLVRRFLRARN